MSIEEIENNWYALYTRSRAEKKVFEQFKKAGIEVYLPVRKELRQWSDRKKWVEVPLINSYIFVNLPSDQIRRVYDIYGVVAFVNDKGKPAIIPSFQIEAMRKTIENHISFTIETKRLEKGQEIEMTSGPLKGIKGEIIKIQGNNKLIVSINHIGYNLVIDTQNASFETLTSKSKESC